MKNISDMGSSSISVRTFASLKEEKYNNDGLETHTSIEQKQVEDTVEGLFNIFSKRAEVDLEAPTLFRRNHSHYLMKHLSYLSQGFQCLDASRPWLCYWILNSLALLEEDHRLRPEDISKIVAFLSNCQCSDGGYGGGPGQYAHLAPTYAAVSALCILGTKEALDSINRTTLLKFLWSVRSPDGAFHMHVGGEADVRGVYCAVDVAKLTNIFSEDLFEGSAEWVISCQSYEGGFSGVPGMEAHGGYAFCGLAALALLGKERLCNTTALLRWLVNRQMRFEGGFQGRTNKLVDGCYSFWQGGTFPIMQRVLCDLGETDYLSTEEWLFHQEALQEYILICCQNPNGGLLDKPTKPTDLYHTCYTLSGMSIAQHCQVAPSRIVGNSENELARTHPLFNISPQSVERALAHFRLPPTAKVFVDESTVDH